MCNQPGHWAGDPECRGPPRSASIVDEEITQTETPIADCIIPKDMEALPASTEAAASPFEHPDSGKGIVDTACARTVAGGEWFEDYKRLLRFPDLPTDRCIGWQPKNRLPTAVTVRLNRCTGRFVSVLAGSV